VSAAAAARAEGQRFEYKRREPQGQVLHKMVREHLEPFLAYTREHYRKPLPKYVERELRGLLRCGDPWHGFTRVRCPRCRHEFFVAFSCGARTVCPSCSGRRMAAASVHLTDRVLPDAPVRQYVLSAPYELRLLLTSRSEVLSAVIRIVMRVLLGWYRKRGRELGLAGAETGAVSFVQRFGGSMNCHTHLHVIVIDGVYSRQEGGATRFHFAEPPSAQELASLVATICERVCRMLRRRGLMGEASHESNEVRLPEAALDGCRTVALSRGRFERLDDQGRAQQRLFADDEQGMRRKKDARWSADWRGFSLHAGVSFGALDRRRHLKLASGDRLAGSTVRS
jgi:ribosomal protein S27E